MNPFHQEDFELLDVPAEARTRDARCNAVGNSGKQCKALATHLGRSATAGRSCWLCDQHSQLVRDLFLKSRPA